MKRTTIDNLRLSSAVAILAILSASNAFSSSTFYVSTTGSDDNAGTSAAPFKTIQKALDSIVGDDSWRSKVIIEAGTYQLESELTVLSGTYTYTIRSASEDPSDVTIDAQGNGRCFNCTGASDISFVGITFINGAASGDGGGVYTTINCSFDNCVISNCTATGRGGGIYASEKLKYVVNSRIEKCTATSDGGGGYFDNSVESMTNCCVYNCSAGAYGGGLRVHCYTASYTNAISDCDISCNEAKGKGGGGLFVKRAVIRNCTFTNNVCSIEDTAANGTGGSGIMLNGDSSTIEGCLVKDNTFTYDCAQYDGGGSAVYLYSGSSLLNSAVIGNSGARSVGLQWVSGGGVLVSNCLFKSNVARRTGGNGRGGILSLYGLNADSLITDCRFIDNQAASHGGFLEMVLDSGSGDATLRIRNCLVAGNVQTANNGLVWANSGTSSSARKLSIENCTFVSNTIPSAPVICTYFEGSGWTSSNFVFASGCAILFNNGKKAFYDNFKASTNISYCCTEMSGMASGNLTYDSTKPLFADLTNGDFRPATRSQLCNVVPASSWMGDGSRSSRSRDLGSGYEVRSAGAYGVDVVWTDTMPRLQGDAADIGCFERENLQGFVVIGR